MYYYLHYYLYKYKYIFCLQITALADKFVLDAQRIMEEKQSELKGDS